MFHWLLFVTYGTFMFEIIAWKVLHPSRGRTSGGDEKHDTLKFRIWKTQGITRLVMILVQVVECLVLSYLS